MSFKHTTTGEWRTITPDTVYKRVNQHIALLPEDPSKWGFFLPWLFYNTLTFQLQNQMIKDKYTLPNPAGYSLNIAQIGSMTECRDKSRVSYKSISDTGRQIRSIMGINSRGSAATNVNVVDYEEVTTPFYDSGEFEGGDAENYEGRRTSSSNVFNPKSRAEETIELE